MWYVRGISEELWIESTSSSIKLSEYYVKARSKRCFSRPLFAKKGSNPVSQTGQDNHHSTLSRNGKGEERGKILETEIRKTQSNGPE